MSKINSLHISAPGKIIISGEHAVVFGKKALACSIDLRTNAVLNETRTNKFEIKFNDINKKIELNEADFLDIKKSFSYEDNNIDLLIKQLNSDDDHINALKLLIITLDELTWDQLSNYELTFTTDLPISAGLGSSASFSTCLVTVFLIISGYLTIESVQTELELINRFTFYLEKLFHAKPSGIDNTVVTYGNYILFQNGQIVEKFKSNFKLDVLIINSNMEKKTREQVEKVKNLHQMYPCLIDSLMNSIDLVCDHIVNFIKTHESTSDSFNQLISINQSLLCSLQISNPKLDSIVNLAAKFNLPCKITGAGGGGCCFALINSNTDNSEFLKALDALNVDFFSCSIACEGVKVESALG